MQLERQFTQPRASHQVIAISMLLLSAGVQGQQGLTFPIARFASLQGSTPQDSGQQFGSTRARLITRVQGSDDDGDDGGTVAQPLVSPPSIISNFQQQNAPPIVAPPVSPEQSSGPDERLAILQQIDGFQQTSFSVGEPSTPTNNDDGSSLSGFVTNRKKTDQISAFIGDGSGSSSQSQPRLCNIATAEEMRQQIVDLGPLTPQELMLRMDNLNLDYFTTQFCFNDPLNPKPIPSYQIDIDWQKLEQILQ